MRRRSFIKSMGALGATSALPFGAFVKTAQAKTPVYSQLQYAPPAVVPQVINIFLYGGPSELAGNLSNINDIDANSQNPYPVSLKQQYVDNGSTPNAELTANNMWRSAGGNEMELMLAAGEMSIYRTINRIKDNTRAHRPSIRSSLTGNLDYDNYPGMGATLAAALLHVDNVNGSGTAVGKPLNQMLLPFVSFEGETTVFQPDGDNPLPLYLKEIALDERFSNPYERTGGDAGLDAFAEPRNQATRERYRSVYEALETRKILEAEVTDLRTNSDSPLPEVPQFLQDGVTSNPDFTDNGVSVDDVTSTTGRRLRYPPQANNNRNGNSRFTDRIKAAVTLALNNPDSIFITVGGGLGGWDDHDNSLTKYEERMSALMRTIRSAVKHIWYSDISWDPADSSRRDTNNIVINVHGDFGRNVNLNGSMGWDHGNNQNLYTFGGSAVRAGGGAALGKIIGTTERFGTSGQNRQFTRPTAGSDQFEPMSIASTVYSYFGIQNPEILTQDPVMNPQGDMAIDETITPAALNPYTA